ncbi:MAG: ATP-binding cassette domain-containing protein [Anaerolineae bacterium]|nr:ATP-binding cassette domain-containing protein [Anaerolineae bacterium]
METGSPPIISVKSLVKTFKVARREEGLTGAVKYLFSRDYEVVKAVDGISFDIFSGEMVGYIGRNGAGKSTTIKMLTGILVPSGGKIEVNGLTPHQKRSENAQNIGVVFGQRTQLNWDIPVIETFRLLKEVYQIPTTTYRQNLGRFSDLLGLAELLKKPVRKLSLGQRMRCDLAASFLHNPKIVYLDEPTIGLDIVAKESIRGFIKSINREQGTTVILTTHDLEDIEDICERTIIIDQGRVVYDGGIKEIKDKFGRYKILTFEVKDRLSGVLAAAWPPGMELQETGEHHFKVRIDRDLTSASEATQYIIDQYSVLDISIEETSIEAVVKKIYQEGWHEAG